MEWRRGKTISGDVLSYTCLLLMVASTGRVLVKAAAVTEQCSKVPPIVNSQVLKPGLHMDNERQYLVTYIRNSDAGFYIKGIRLTASMIIKGCYLFSAILATLGTTVLRTSRSKGDN